MEENWIDEIVTCRLEYDYEAQMAEYVELAYKTLKTSRNRIPTRARMEKPLKIMFVIHNRDKFEYTTIEEFAETLKKIVGISEDTVYQRVVGPRISVLYEGIRMLLNKYVRIVEGQNRIIDEVWYYYDKSRRYTLLIRAEEKLYAAMLRKLEHSGRL